MENTELSTEQQTPSTVDTPLTEEPETETTAAVPTETETLETKLDEETVPTVTEEKEETTKPTDEQENVIAAVTPSVPPTSLSPGRANIPLKEVNESEKEEPTMLSNGTDTANSKKRELEPEEGLSEENGTDSDERTSDQTKKMKTNETIDTPIIETKEVELNHVNGTNGIEA